MSVGEVAEILGITRSALAKMLKAKTRLTPRMAYLLSEIFGWERAARWWWMQGKCDMYESAVAIRDGRRALASYHSYDDGSEWEAKVKETWIDMELDDLFEESHNPSVEPETATDQLMEEELKDAGLE